MVRYASTTGAGLACTQSSPCAISEAFASVDSAHPRVKLAEGTYNANLAVSGKTIIVHGKGAMVNAAAGARTLDISDGADVRLLGISLANPNAPNAGITLACQPSGNVAKPTLVVDDAVIDSDSNSALFGDDCTISITNTLLRAHNGAAGYPAVLFGSGTMQIDRSVIDGGDGIQNIRGTVRVKNSVIKNQTGPNGALLAVSPGSTFVSFSTIENSLVKCGSGLPACASGTAGGVNGVCIDNSIVYNAGGPADTVQGTACILSRTLVYPQTTTPSGTNNQVGLLPQLRSPSTGDYHLLSTSPAIDAADPTAQNPVDFDGITRPQGAGYDIGAFEYKP